MTEPVESLQEMQETQSESAATEYEWVAVEEYKFNISREAKLRGLNESELFFDVFEYGIEEGIKRCEIWQATFRSVSVRLNAMVLDVEEVSSEIGFLGGVVVEVLWKAEHPEPNKRVRFVFRGRLGLRFWEVGSEEFLGGWLDGLQVRKGLGVGL